MKPRPAVQAPTRAETAWLEATVTSVPHDREDQLRDACRGVDLDDREERVIGWLASMTDAATCETIASILEKVREAGYLTRVVERADAAEKPPPIVIERPDWVAGNSGPGW